MTPKLSRVDMDAVAPLMPHDKTAAVVGGKGVHYEIETPATLVHTGDPLPIREPTRSELGQPTFRNLTGLQIGRLRVVGLYGVRTSDGASWVVRCVCGSFETRKTKFLKKCQDGENPGEHEPMCSWCLNTRRLQKGKGKKREERKWREVLGEDFPR